MGSWRAVGILMILVACNDGASGPNDAPPVTPLDAPADATDATDGTDGAAALTCPQIAAQLRTRAAATSNECTVPADCLAVGYPVRDDGTPSCNCGVAYAGSCGGAGVNAAAWAADATATALETEWYARCVPLGAASGVTGICDCSVGAMACNASHQCVSGVRSCLSDAGVN